MLNTDIVPAYAYNQFKDDINIKAFFDFFNLQAQDYLTALTNLNIPVFAGLKGDMLDYVANNIYGIPRPYYTTVSMPDDVYHDVLMWYLFLGDGKIQNIRWLKKRIARFCKTSPSTVSISFNTTVGQNQTIITLTTSVKANLFRYLVLSKQIRLPENNWVVTLV